MKRQRKILLKRYILLAVMTTGNTLLAQVPANFSSNGCETSIYSGHVEAHERSYQLVFEDDFDGSAINTDNWQTYFPWGRTLKNTSTPTGYEWSIREDDNVTVSSGYLHLVNEIDPGARNVYDCSPTGDCSWAAPTGYPGSTYFKYTSGMIYSKAGYKAGKVEMRAKVPYTDGTWPAFWLYGTCGQELDVFEMTNLNATSNSYYDSKNLWLTYHINKGCTSSYSCVKGTVFSYYEPLGLDFHTYSFEWDATMLIWKLDGVIIRQVYRYWDNSYPLPLTTADAIQDELNPVQFDYFPSEDNEMHVIINNGVGYDRGTYPQDFVVDYIKVYEKSDCYTDRTLCTYYPPYPPVISSKTITTGPSCNFTITSGQDVEMKALNNIELKPGFKSNTGSHYLGHITYCENYEVKTSAEGSGPVRSNPNAFADILPDSDKNATLIEVEPNPNNGLFALTTKEEGKKTVVVYDVSGKTVFQRDNVFGQNIDIDIVDQPKGIYFVKVISGSDVQVKKIINQ
jgi:beta-glucanase (GH16 family)